LVLVSDFDFSLLCFVKLVVFSHKPCWPSLGSPSGYATNGGFPFQMKALSELFDATVLLVPCLAENSAVTETQLTGNRLSIVPLLLPPGNGVWRKLLFPFWLLRNLPRIASQLWHADAVHAPIPGDVGTIGMLGAVLMRKPLFVRYCGNWLKTRTPAEKFWHWFMERFAGGRNVMLATGGAATPPSRKNPNVTWIFSTSLTKHELGTYAFPRSYPSARAVRLITVARQEPGKGTDLIIRALPLLHREFPGISLDVVGDGAAVADLKALSASLSMEGSVRFCGSVSHGHVLELLRSADLFCFPSASEGFPKAVLEALACGLPVVATPISVLPQLLGTGCGVLIEKPAPEALAYGIRQALGSPAVYERLSRKAIETAKGYSLEAWRDAIGAHLAIAWGTLKTQKHIDTSRPCALPVQQQSTTAK
jgi:glycosyltransferase involved in cell wall biosynthesis